MHLPSLRIWISFILAIGILPTFCVISAQSEVPDNTGLKLKEVYEGWSKSMAENDFALWQKNTAMYRQIGTRNMIVSQKKKWPDSLFDGPVKPPNIGAMELTKVMVNGSTAQLVYYGKADFGVGEEVKVPDGLLFLMFIKEKDGWKFSTSRFMNLNTAEEIAASAKSGDFSFLDSPQFKPPGQVPPLPKLCPLPEIVGYIEIVSIGYETKVNIGDRSKHMVINNVHKGLVIGGLKKGINPIFIETRSLPTQEDKGEKTPSRSHFELNVYRESNREKKDLKQIYSTGVKENPGKFKVIVRGDG